MKFYLDCNRLDCDQKINKKRFCYGRNYKEKAHFVIQFGNDNKGTLTIVDDVYDSQI